MIKALIFAWHNLRHRLWTSLAISGILTLGLFSLSMMFRIENGMSQGLKNQLEGTDLLLCAKGSPTQAILANVLHIDNPTGNIAKKDAERWLRDPAIHSIRRIAYGDRIGTSRILGCDSATWNHIPIHSLQGHMPINTLDAVIGQTLAEREGLVIGDIFHGSHGMEGDHGHHDHHDYQVVGIIQSQAPWDNLAITPIESVWDVHHDKDSAYTAVLASISNPMKRLMLPGEIQRNSTLMAVSPALEGNRMLGWMNRGADMLNAMAVLMEIIGLASLILLLQVQVRARRTDFALMQAMGGSWLQIFHVVAWQHVFVATMAILLNYMLLGAAHQLQSWWLPAELAWSDMHWGLGVWDLQLAAVLLSTSLLLALWPWFILKRISLHRALVDA